MSPSSKPTRNRRSWRSVGALALLMSLLAAACSGSDVLEDAADVAAIETNDGGVLVKPPDALEGDVEEPVDPTDLPPLVEGLNPTPVVSFNYFDGTASSTADFTGRPTVVNFWASTCAACIAEMPEFEEAFQAVRADVDFVGVNVADVSREAAVRLAGQTGVTYPLADDTSSEVFRAFGGFVMPTTVLLNPQGQVAFVWSGVLTGEELQNLIREHIAPESGSDV